MRLEANCPSLSTPPRSSTQRPYSRSALRGARDRGLRRRAEHRPLRRARVPAIGGDDAQQLAGDAREARRGAGRVSRHAGRVRVAESQRARASSATARASTTSGRRPGARRARARWRPAPRPRRRSPKPLPDIGSRWRQSPGSLGSSSSDISSRHVWQRNGMEPPPWTTPMPARVPFGSIALQSSQIALTLSTATVQPSTFVSRARGTLGAEGSRRAPSALSRRSPSRCPRPARTCSRGRCEPGWRPTGPSCRRAA